MEIRKTTKLYNYLFSDFDKDGVKNIDDPQPLNSQVSDWPKQTKTSGFYHESRLGGGSVKLSDELLALKRQNDQHKPVLMNFLENNQGSFGRIKTVPSTMKKLRERYYDKLGDIAGAKVLTTNRKEAYKKAEIIKTHYPTDQNRYDDYYKHPLGGVHHALHLSLFQKAHPNNKLEVQIQSNKMADISRQAHFDYKQGIIRGSLIKKSKSLFKRGF